jgi:hypothetical protein
MKKISPSVFFRDLSVNRHRAGGAVTFCLLALLMAGGATAQVDDPSSRQAMVQELALAHNSPNPFNATTTITYTLLQDAHVRVDVFDLKGRHLVTLLDEFQAAGERFAVWKTLDTPSGTYFFRLAVADIVVFGKMALVQ